MKNLILNLLSIISLAIFWVLFIATSPDVNENFGALNMEASKTITDVTLKNNDSFDYDEIDVRITYLDTLTNSSGNDSLDVHSYTTRLELVSNESKTISFKDFDPDRNRAAPDSIFKIIQLSVEHDCPDFDICFFDMSLD